MKCLDTTFLIDIMKGDRAAIRKAEELVPETTLVSTEINIFELACGIEMSRTGEVRRKRMALDLQTLLDKIPVLPLERSGTLAAAKILGEQRKNGMQMDSPDALVAGIALAHGCDTIVTRNKRHFDKVKGLKVETY